MADKKTSAETAATTLDGTELVRGVQGGASVKVTIDQIKAYIVGNLGAATAKSLALAGAISAASWGLTGVGYTETARTITDTSGAGTVATGATHALGGNTIAASNARTVTDYYSAYVKDPIAGANVTITNKWSLGLEGRLKAAGATLALGTITAAAPVIDASVTWNAGGVTFTGLKLNVTDTASASSSMLFDAQAGSVSQFYVRKNGVVVATTRYEAGGNPNTPGSVLGDNVSMMSTSTLGWTSTSSALNTVDTILRRDAANTLALQNGTSAQLFYIYNTWSSAGSNHERLEIGANAGTMGANTFGVMVNKAGTGTSRPFYMGTNAASPFGLVTNGTVRWQVDGNGNFIANADNTYDIGASGANRPRNVYVANNITTGGTLTGASQISTGAGGYIQWVNRCAMSSPADGQLILQNWAGTDFGRLCFGGTTSSFPAIKRSSTDLQVRLADDSGYAGLQLGSTSAALKVGTHSAIAAETVTGYITIKDSAGTDRKIAVVS